MKKSVGAGTVGIITSDEMLVAGGAAWITAGGILLLAHLFGRDEHGFNVFGRDKEGFDRDGYDKQGYDRSGFDKAGFNASGYNAKGYDRKGYDRQGYDADGFDRHGFDINGFNSRGYDRSGFDVSGFDVDGLDRAGHTRGDYLADGEALRLRAWEAHRQMCCGDPDAHEHALMTVRKGLEKAVRDILTHYEGVGADTNSLGANMHAIKGYVDEDIYGKINGARRHCNDAMHDKGESKSHDQVHFCCMTLKDISELVSGLAAA